MSKVGIAFEVFGKVQGVFFRKYTQTKANELGLIGWVQNTDKGTVIGEAEGEKAAVEKFKHWLCKEGSPSSKIERCEVHETKLSLPLKGFVVKRDDKITKQT